MFADNPPSDPLKLFAEWFEEAKESELNDPNAVAVASVGADGTPSVRMVLLKDYDARGFVFYTNYESKKGTQLRAHPKGAMLFHWKSLRRQVRIEGDIEQVSAEEADEYFASRRQSQIGAWASDQSRPLESRFALEKKVAKLAAKFGVSAIPRPAHWSGFRLQARYIEFWKDGAFRLHDRVAYTRDRLDQDWSTARLYP